MAVHPIETTVINGVAVNKATFREEVKQYARAFATAASFRTYDLPNVPIAVIAGVLFKYDSTDLVSADDGVTVILDVSSRRFKRAAVAASVTGSTIFTANTVAGTNNVTANTNGMAAPSATPQYLMITPAITNTAAVDVALDGGAAIALVSPQGAALAAGEWIAGTPYMVRVLNTEIRIMFSGATW